MTDNTQDPGTSTSGEQAAQPSLQLSDLVLALHLRERGYCITAISI